MKNALIVIALACVFGFTHSAYAAWEHKSSSTGKSKNTSGKYIRKKCKTPACFKKHPSGEYTVPVGKRK